MRSFGSLAGLLEKEELSLAPVYQCTQVYEFLHAATGFQTLYKQKRKDQLQRALDNQSGDLRQESALARYLAPLAGFFIVEDAVLKSGNEVLTKHEVETLWDSVTARLRAVLGEVCRRIADPMQFLRVKYTVVLFCCTVETYGVNVMPVLEAMFQQRELFAKLLVERLRCDLRETFASDKFDPLRLSNVTDYEEFVLAYELMDASVHVDFPFTVPFSVSVPLVCRLLKEFVKDLAEFFHRLVDPLEGDAFTYRTLDNAVIQEVNACLVAFQKSARQSMHISQVVQLAINTGVLLEFGCPFVEKELMACAYNRLRLPREGQLTARDVMRSTRSLCEDTIYELINLKIESFLSEVETTDWCPSSGNKHPNGYVQDLVAYLESTFVSLVFLPDPVRDRAHHTACCYINERLLSMLHGPQVKKLNQIGLWNLNQDLIELEDYADRCSVAALRETFRPLREFVDLFMGGDVAAILDSKTRVEQFPHLNLRQVVDIMDKFKDLGLFSSPPAGMRKVKKSTVETVAKKLREIIR